MVVVAPEVHPLLGSWQVRWLWCSPQFLRLNVSFAAVVAAAFVAVEIQLPGLAGGPPLLSRYLAVPCKKSSKLRCEKMHV